jgi:4-aminobutyrate aminotransferase-like enzyme/Ser/Thr protein kinase RdoA (MazF antagonist)
MSDYNLHKISSEQAAQLAFDHYGLAGKVDLLPGELDYNFKISCIDGLAYILKVSRPHSNRSFLDFQQELLIYLEKQTNFIGPKVILDNNGSTISDWTDHDGQTRSLRLLSWVEGRLWCDVNPQLPRLRQSLGELCGSLTMALKNFDHREAHRTFEWDVAQSLWTKEHISLFSEEDKLLVQYFQNLFEHSNASYSTLRKSIVHNDANSHNVLVSDSKIDPGVCSVIDFGDTIYTQVINDVAIATAYAIMGQEDPLDAAISVVQGYHKTYPLTAMELPHLYPAVAMRMIISVTKSAINKKKEPENKYLLISEKPAWDALKKWSAVDKDFAHYSFRYACGLNAHPQESAFGKWTKKQQFQFNELFPNQPKEAIHLLDLSVSSNWVGSANDFNDLDFFQFKIEALQKKVPDKIIAGGYLEPRVLYTSEAYDRRGNYGKESRTIHLGIDFWLPSETPVHALFDGEIVTAVNDKGDKEYGGLVILKHHTQEFEFYTLYGHLNPIHVATLKLGNKISKGSLIGYLGNYPENGNWAPHLHFQIMLSMLNYEYDYPGVAYHSQLDVWKSLCPDPNLFFNNSTLKIKPWQPGQSLLEYRKNHLGKSLSLQYKNPIHVVRGSGSYLLDNNGKKYLDTVNNVAHVGHEHPDVVATGQEQMATLNTNTRYLHKNINAFAKVLLKTLPEPLSVVHFVNSGSEANELALRMVKTNTGSKEMIVSESGYHGNTNSCIDISSYKFDSKSGKGAPDTTYVIPIPDTFRGIYRGKKAGDRYASEVQKQIEIIAKKQRKLGGFIIEPIISCGGQIELPSGFLKKSYQIVREAGGLCISDEVQVGCGRIGSYFWGFELYGVVPDIVTIGKPLGNGHPVAAVVCTREVADKFANGMEYFNTFGGNPVSCAIGLEVLHVIEREKLQRNAKETGTFLKNELLRLSESNPIIGDVRGQGLFLGFELVNAKLEPLPNQADYLVNRMKSYGILMSADGPDNNVIKIKPPLSFTMKHALELLHYLDLVINEDFMKKH